MRCYCFFSMLRRFQFFPFISFFVVYSSCSCYFSLRFDMLCSMCLYSVIFFSVFGFVVSVIHCSYIYFRYFWCALPRMLFFLSRSVRSTDHSSPLALFLPSISTVSFDFVQFICEQCVRVAVSGIYFHLVRLLPWRKMLN